MYKHEVSSQPREDSQTSNRTLTEDEDEEETGGGQTQDILWSHLALRGEIKDLKIGSKYSPECLPRTAPARLPSSSAAPRLSTCKCLFSFKI